MTPAAAERERLLAVARAAADVEDWLWQAVGMPGERALLQVHGDPLAAGILSGQLNELRDALKAWRAAGHPDSEGQDEVPAKTWRSARDRARQALRSIREFFR